MTETKGAEAPKDASPQAREAILRWSHSGWRWYAYPGAEQLWGGLSMVAAGGCILLSMRLLGENVQAFLIGLPFGLACLIVPCWLMWSYLPKRDRRRQHAALTKALTEKLRAVRFKDGSVSDFSPTGGILLTYDAALIFDAPRLLGRNFEHPGAGMLTDIDWIWSMEDFDRLEVREVAVRGWWQRVRKALGAKPRMRLALSGFARKDGTPVDWPIAPGYEAAARKIAAALTCKLAARDLGV